MNKELETAIMTAGDLPTIPVVATKVMQLMESETTTAEELARVVASDPAVAARVIKISNSSFYGCQRQIQTLSTAIVILGFNTLKSLVVAASVKQVYKPFGLTEKMLWEHSFAAGLAARIIASSTRAANEEEAFLGGLFHDIGKIIMNSLDKDKFQQVMQRCYNEGLTFEDAEASIFPFCHDEVGAYVVKKWNFPLAMTNAILQHHKLQFDDPNDIYQINLTAVIALADMFCLKLGIGEREPQESLDLAASTPASMLNLDETRIDMLLNLFTEAFEKDKSYFVT
ncbi:metal-dependent phosphohydrolase [Geotalea daltonii FRC-32]|uniref:Metal-dependent phosphohydrolase n=1 Tax=Geotalea daltonii (strain DSM 22248 / JCM 15807 / FRC-32) TaxID=316067 RepID=B9LZT9_GEODF|nr:MULTISPECIES: HDOD domain-containing protein [Geotalea]ACM18903.1 metal-dependent phosphohydrolase [Geotalea daltonii FRC-32]